MSTPVASDDDSFTDGDYDPFSDVGPRFPVHDAVEFQPVDALRNLIFVPRNSHNSDDSDSSDDSSSDGGGDSSDDSSGTDGERDSAAAAAAATGITAAAAATVTPAAADDTATVTPAAVPATAEEDASAAPESEAKSEESRSNAIEEAIGDSSMEVENLNDEPMSSPGKSKNTDESLQDISPVKLDSSMIEEIQPNVKELANQLNMAVSSEGNGVVNDSTAANVADKRAPKKKSKKKKRKKKDTVSYYCPHDINLRDPNGNTALHVAIHARKLEHAKLILEAKANPNSKCDHSAPIHTAIAIGAITSHKDFSYDAVELLSKYDADLQTRDDSGHTPLYLATMHNLPSVAGLLLNDPIGIQTLNLKSNRSGGRPLHAAAKFDTSKGKLLGKSTGNGIRSPDGGVASKAIMTQMLLNTPGIEVDALNNYGQSPLHIAASRGNWVVVNLLLSAGANPQLKDQRGLTPGILALKRGMPIPNELAATLCPSTIAPITGANIPPKRDLIIDPDGQTFLICHELCSQHLTCPPITRNVQEPPPENIRRLSVLLDKDVGILRGADFDSAKWEGECRRAAMTDVLKVHEYKYVEQISQLCSEIPDHPNAIAHLDSDTGLSRWSFEAAMRAAGSVCEAVDRVLTGDFRNAFCAVRPPGHHSGPRGIVKCEKDPEGSHGFCLLNNVAIGAAYARSMYRNDGIKKVAIIDFDVHHGNGTEAVVRNLVPSMDKATISLPFAVGQMETPQYRPWLDETDVDNVFFASAHGYGPRTLRQHDMEPHPGWFYPSSGRSYASQNVRSPSSVLKPSVEDFIFTQSWARLGDEARMNCCKIINVGLNLPHPGETPGMQRVQTRDAYRKNILPNLVEFNPDIIFISAGFDAHKRDEMNYGYVGMVEEDYEWVTEELIKVANTCCNGRVVSVLEGGYRIHGGIVSPFAKSVASHVRGLMDGSNSRELYDKAEGEWESRFEREMVEERERKRQLRIQRFSRPYAHIVKKHQASPAVPAAEQQETDPLAAAAENAAQSDVNEMDALMQMPLGQAQVGSAVDEIPSKADEPSAASADEGRPTKRKRPTVDYQKMFEQMKKEGLV